MMRFAIFSMLLLVALPAHAQSFARATYAQAQVDMLQEQAHQQEQERAEQEWHPPMLDDAAAQLRIPYQQPQTQPQYAFDWLLWLQFTATAVTLALSGLVAYKQAQYAAALRTKDKADDAKALKELRDAEALRDTITNVLPNNKPKK